MTTDAPLESASSALCLVFANTLRPSASSADATDLGYSNLVEWAQGAGLVDQVKADSLVRLASARPGDAAAVTGRATALRDAVYRIFSALAEGSEPRSVDVECLNEAIREALPHLRLRPGSDCWRWTWSMEGDDLGRMLWPVARSAADLLTSSRIGRVRECASETCTWLFLDTSRNGRRKWCDMATCGNRAKARRYYRRRRDDTAPP